MKIVVKGGISKKSLVSREWPYFSGKFYFICLWNKHHDIFTQMEHAYEIAVVALWEC